MVYDINENEVTEHEPIPALEQYPYEDDDGKVWENLICHYAPDDQKVICAETGEVYDKAIDLYPCKLHYFVYEEQPEPEETIDTDMQEEV